MIIFHADDYGINMEQSKRILDCRKKGVLNSVSIMPNSIHLDQTIPLLDRDIRKSIHINMAEGRCCATPEKIPLLVKENTFFRGFGSMLLLSLLCGRELEKQVETECTAQIKCVKKYLEKDYKIRIDSHLHYHMIPSVFRGLCKALKASGSEVEYIRYPVEKLLVYVKVPGVWKYIRPVNVAKIILLKLFGMVNKRTLKQYGYENKTGGFFGLMFTGLMCERYVKPVLNEYVQYCQSKGKDLEVLFHPGAIHFGEEFLQDSKREYMKFYMADDRNTEANTLEGLRKNYENIFSC